MYRCVALAALERAAGGCPSAPRPLGELARALAIDPGAAPDGRAGRCCSTDRDVTEAIRAPEVSEAASVVAADPLVRAALVAKQRELIARWRLGRRGTRHRHGRRSDAALKVFLTAAPGERARRRAVELGADAATVLAEQAMRDERDVTRAHSPLKPAAGAITLDTTGLSVEEVVADRRAGAAIEPLRSRSAKPPHRRRQRGCRASSDGLD